MVAGQDEVDLLWGPQLDGAEHGEPAVHHVDLPGLQVDQHRPAGLLVALPFYCWREMRLGQLGASSPPPTPRCLGEEEGQLRAGVRSRPLSSMSCPAYWWSSPPNSRSSSP